MNCSLQVGNCLADELSKNRPPRFILIDRLNNVFFETRGVMHSEKLSHEVIWGAVVGDDTHKRERVSGNGPQTMLIETKDFKKARIKKENNKPLEWSKITTFAITLTDTKTKRKINLASPTGAEVLKRIELVKP